MFIQSCFIRKNTKELREKLEKLGYKILPNLFGWVGLVTMDIGVCVPAISNKRSNAIDCGENEELFLAIAALRDDTDDKQLFTDSKKDWCTCEVASFEGKKFSGFSFNYLPDNINYDSYHKATVEELIEHFKTE